MDNDRITKLNDLVEAIAFYRDHPEVPLPYAFDNGSNKLISYLPGDATTREYALLAKKNGFRFKGVSEWHFSLTQKVGNLTLSLAISREKACTKIIKGTHTVPSYTTPEQVIEDYEWKCEPILEQILEANEPS